MLYPGQRALVILLVFASFVMFASAYHSSFECSGEQCGTGDSCPPNCVCGESGGQKRCFTITRRHWHIAT
uniref:Putative salivary protein n=1 Tax=Ornithodoros parkeri TaxID=140564 RepID=A6N9T6_ORNPR|nr:putative salivary protein [Ornithodoros parkeri]